MSGVENDRNGLELIKTALSEGIDPPVGLRSGIMGYIKRAEIAERERRSRLVRRARELVFACAACLALVFGLSAALAPLAALDSGGAVAAGNAETLSYSAKGTFAEPIQAPKAASEGAFASDGDMIFSADIVISVSDVEAAARLVGDLGGGVLSSRSGFNDDGEVYSYYAETAVSSASFDGYLEDLRRIGQVSSVVETRRKVSSVLDMNGALARVGTKEDEIRRIFELYSRVGDVRGMDIVSKNLDGVLGELDGLKSAANYWGGQTRRASVRVTLVKAYVGGVSVTNAGFGRLVAERLRWSGFAAREALLTFAGLIAPLAVFAAFGWVLIRIVKRIDRRVQHA